MKPSWADPTISENALPPIAPTFEGEMTAVRVADRPQKTSENQRFEPRAEGGAADVSVAIPADFRLENGAALPDAAVRLRRHGRLDGPVVIAAGGISADRAVAGEGGWWGDVVAAGGGIDLERYQVIGFDFSPADDHRLAITPLDQARLLLIAVDALAIARIHGFVGASYGGMVGLALAALAPERVARLCVISAAHQPAPLAAGWRGVQRRIVEYAIAHGEAAEGLALARQLAMITYRSADEFSSRFERTLDAEGQSDLDRYLVSRGAAYVDRMSPQRWLSLSEAIDRCWVKPEAVNVATTLVACPTDQLVPISEMRALAARLPQLTVLHELPSLYGHDAFLKEPARLGVILSNFLEGQTHDDA
ncbi:MAG: homoserine O-succinyltransferase [Terricaulis sp.]